MLSRFTELLRMFIGILLFFPALALAENGDVFLIGGAIRTEEIIEALGKFSGGRNAKILIAPFATKLPEQSINILKEQFSVFEPASIESAPAFPEKFDPTEVKGTWCTTVAFREVRPIFTQAERSKFISDLEEATVLYFTGGNQNRIMKVMHEEPEIMAAIKKFFARGGLYAGTSAGTAAVPALMMNGSVAKMVDGTEVAVLDIGLGLLPRGIHIDQHFVQRNRYDRLRNLIVQHQSDLGIGISESTAAHITAKGVLTVYGESEVILYFYKVYGGDMITVHLKRGDRFDLNARVKI